MLNREFTASISNSECFVTQERGGVGARAILGAALPKQTLSNCVRYYAGFVVFFPNVRRWKVDGPGLMVGACIRWFSNSRIWSASCLNGHPRLERLDKRQALK